MYDTRIPISVRCLEVTVVSTTAGLCVVLVAASILLTNSMESTVWELSMQRPRIQYSATGDVDTLTPHHCMDHATRGQLMLHTCTASHVASTSILGV